MRPVRYASIRDVPGGVKVHIVEDSTGSVVATGQWISTKVLAYIRNGRPLPGYSMVASRAQRTPRGRETTAPDGSIAGTAPAKKGAALTPGPPGGASGDTKTGKEAQDGKVARRERQDRLREEA